ncbi:MAG: MlaD family protein [Aeromicrobium erythreum]
MIDPTLVDQDLADRGTAARRGLAMLVALVVVGAVLVAAGRGAFSDGTDVTARLDDAGGALAPGSDVKVDGVVVGRVTSLRGGEGDARVGLRLDGDADEALTAGTTARIMPATVFGTTYVGPRAAGAARGRPDPQGGQRHPAGPQHRDRRAAGRPGQHGAPAHGGPAGPAVGDARRARPGPRRTR